MDQYRLRNRSMNSTYPPTNKHPNTGPLYSMCSSSKIHNQVPQLFMNTPSLGTPTIQLVPARIFSTTCTPSKHFPITMGLGSYFDNIRSFFTSWLLPSKDNSTSDMYGTADKRKSISTPNIFLDIMPNREDFDNNSLVNLSNLETLSKLTVGTKSFSECYLPITIPKYREINSKMKIICDEPESIATKEIVKYESIVADLIKLSTPKLPMHDKPKKNRKIRIKSNVPSMIRRQCSKVSTKMRKNRKQKVKHRLAFTINEDVKTETANECDESIVSISTMINYPIASSQSVNSGQVCFSNDDFPALSTVKRKSNSIMKQAWEIPKHCISSFASEKQRQVSECDSEDSFIVFDYDDKADCEQTTEDISENSEDDDDEDDDFICFEKEDNDEDDNDVFAEADSESDDDELPNNQPDSGLGERRVRFNPKVEIHYLITWCFAQRRARMSPWEQIGRDRVRFHQRINLLDLTIAPILESEHRQKIYSERFVENEGNDNCDNTIGT